MFIFYKKQNVVPRFTFGGGFLVYQIWSNEEVSELITYPCIVHISWIFSKLKYLSVFMIVRIAFEMIESQTTPIF